MRKVCISPGVCVNHMSCHTTCDSYPKIYHQGEIRCFDMLIICIVLLLCLIVHYIVFVAARLKAVCVVVQQCKTDVVPTPTSLQSQYDINLPVPIGHEFDTN